MNKYIHKERKKERMMNERKKEASKQTNKCLY